MQQLRLGNKNVRRGHVCIYRERCTHKVHIYIYVHRAQSWDAFKATALCEKLDVIPFKVVASAVTRRPFDAQMMGQAVGPSHDFAKRPPEMRGHTDILAIRTWLAS